MPLLNLDTYAKEPVCQRVDSRITATDEPTTLGERVSKPRHSNAANADEMNMACFVPYCVHVRGQWCYRVQ